MRQGRKDPGILSVLAFSGQWLLVDLSSAVATVIGLGPLLGLDQPQITHVIQRSLLLAGLASCLQPLLGHRLPIQEGPAGVWTGTIVVLTQAATAVGKPLSVLRTDLEGGLLGAGVVLCVLAAFGIVRHARKLMTPAVTGTFLVLLSLQVCGPFLRGLLGIGGGAGNLELQVALLGVGVVAGILGLAYAARGTLQQMAVAIGLTGGWVLAALAGLVSPWPAETAQIAGAMWPALFAWGPPTWDPGVLVSAIAAGLLVLTNVFGAVAAMERVTGREVGTNAYSRGGMVAGFNHLLSGLGASPGIGVYTHSAALVELTGTAAITPVVLAGAVQMVLALVPGVPGFLSLLPLPVSYAVLFALFVRVADIGLRTLSPSLQSAKSLAAVSTGLVLGVSVNFIPPSQWAGLSWTLAFVAGNGVLIGTLACLFLEQAARFRSGPRQAQ